MTVVNPKSISGINSITTGSGSDDILTIHTNNGTERLRVDSTGTTKIVTGIVTTLTATTGIVTTLTSNTTTLNSTTTATGNINVSGANITLGDSGGASDDRLTFGAGTDLSIYHDGSHSRIVDSGTGFLTIQSSRFQINNAANSENMAAFIEDGAVELYHNNSKKFETYANGCTVTGNLNAGNVDLTDSAKARFGASNDLQIYHDGTDNYLESTGKLYIKSSNFVDIRSSGNETMIKATPNGAVELYYDNSNKLETSSSGVTVTGQLTSTASNNGQIIHTFKNTDATSSSSAMTVEQHFNFNRTGGGLNLSAAKIVAGKEREWVGAAANQDGYFAIHTTQNETSAEKIRVNSAGDLLYTNNDRNYACWYKSPTNPSTSAATNSAGFLTYGTAVIANTDVYNTSNGRYTAPVDGLYLIRANGLIDNSSSTGGKQIHLYKNGSTYGAQIAYQTISSKNQGDYELMSGTGIMYMSAGDYAQVHASGGMHVSNETNLIVYLIRGTV